MCTFDEASERLQATLALLSEREEQLTARIAQQRTLGTDAVRCRNRTKAIHHLRLKKLCEATLERTHRHYNGVLQMSLRLEHIAMTLKTADTLRKGADALNEGVTGDVVEVRKAKEFVERVDVVCQRVAGLCGVVDDDDDVNGEEEEDVEENERESGETDVVDLSEEGIVQPRTTVLGGTFEESDDEDDEDLYGEKIFVV